MAKKKETKDTKGLFAGAAIAGIAAAAAGYYFYGPRGKQHRSVLKSWTLKAHADVMDQLHKLKEIDRTTFNKVVDDVAGKYKKARGVAASEVAAFAKEVKDQWGHIEKEFEKGAAKGKKAVKKTAKKAVKKAKKATK